MHKLSAVPTVVRRINWLAAISSVGVIAAIAIITVAVTLAFGISLGDSDSPPADAVQETPVTEPGQRERLGVCISVLDAEAAPASGSAAEATAALALDQITTALAKVAENRFWDDAGYGGLSLEPASGCPLAPLPARFKQGEWRNGNIVGLTGVPEISSGSFYRVSVFVMPLSAIDSLLGGSEDRITAQEFACEVSPVEGRSCRQIATGVYVTPEELSDRLRLQTLIERGFGFGPPR